MGRVAARSAPLDLAFVRWAALDVHQDSAGVLAGLSGLAENDSIEVAVSGYSSRDLALLAGQGWRDGPEQIRSRCPAI